MVLSIQRGLSTLLQQDGEEVIMTKHTIRAARSGKSIIVLISNFTDTFSCS